MKKKQMMVLFLFAALTCCIFCGIPAPGPAQTETGDYVTDSTDEGELVADEEEQEGEDERIADEEEQEDEGERIADEEGEEGEGERIADEEGEENTGEEPVTEQ